RGGGEKADDVGNAVGQSHTDPVASAHAGGDQGFRDGLHLLLQCAVRETHVVLGVDDSDPFVRNVAHEPEQRGRRSVSHTFLPPSADGRKSATACPRTTGTVRPSPTNGNPSRTPTIRGTNCTRAPARSRRDARASATARLCPRSLECSRSLQRSIPLAYRPRRHHAVARLELSPETSERGHDLRL